MFIRLEIYLKIQTRNLNKLMSIIDTLTCIGQVWDTVLQPYMGLRLSKYPFHCLLWISAVNCHCCNQSYKIVSVTHSHACLMAKLVIQILSNSKAFYEAIPTSSKQSQVLSVCCHRQSTILFCVWWYAYLNVTNVGVYGLVLMIFRSKCVPNHY